MGSNFKAIAKALRSYERLFDAKSLHSHLLKHGLTAHIFIANNLMTMYADFDHFDDAHKLFDEMPHRNVASWTASISAHTRAGSPSDALAVFARMVDGGSVAPNGYTFSAALKACAVAGNLDMGRWIHDRVSAEPRFRSDIVLMNAVVDMYAKCGRMEEARHVFNAISLPNSTSWNTMISGYVRCGNLAEAENLFRGVDCPDAVSFNTMIAGFAQNESPKVLEYARTMHILGVKLDHFTLPSALKTCGSLRFKKMGKQIHGYIMKCGFGSNASAGSSLVDMYSKCGLMDEAARLFSECSSCKGFKEDRKLLLNSLASGFALNGFNRSALGLVREIHSSGAGLDAFTLSTALKVCINLNNYRIGRQVHGLTVTKGYQLHHVVGTVLVDLYVRYDKLEDSLRLFLGLPHKDLIAWSGLISGCVQRGSNQLAFFLFREMIRMKLEIDHFIVTSILKACSLLSWLPGGKQVHGFCTKGGYELESFVLTSLIDMYSKCGDIEDGLRVFETGTVKDMVCWTGMIMGCGYNGRANMAIELFQKMIESGEKPNEVTVLGVLSACKHAGMVGEACAFFDEMREKHGLVPTLEHYCCMVDILSRSGLFKEAQELVNVMPYAADKTIWNSLLGAYENHKNVEISRLPVFSLDASTYVAMSNAYASVGKWVASAHYRKMMRMVGMKETGRSWVEVRA